MALVSTGFRLSVNLTDTSGSISTLQYELTAALQADAVATAANIIAALQAVTDSLVSSYYLAEVFEEDAPAFPANAINAIKASISAYLDEPGQKRANIKIPAPKVGVFVSATGPGNNQVNGDAPIVDTYLQLFTSTGGEATLSDGQSLRDTGYFAGGKRISRGSQNP